MNPPIKRATILAKIAMLLSVVSLISIFLMNGTFGTSTAQSEKRVLENTIPKHLPIKVKIKKEKEDAVGDLKNEKWMRDFQLEVTNTGDKPIYYLSLFVDLPGITIPNGTDGMGFSLHFGRRELYDIEAKAKPDDISIQPGETYVFSLSEARVQDWESFMQKEHKPPVKKLILYFQLMSFGDGTGFASTGGLPVPNPPVGKSKLDGCQPKPNLSDSEIIESQHTLWRIQPATYSTDDLPAKFLLANFYRQIYQ